MKLESDPWLWRSAPTRVTPEHGIKVSQFGKNSPMGRPAQPTELASDESRYVNGEVLGVTGGTPLG